MNNNFLFKLKDRKPEDTINIIREFFINKGFNIHILTNFQSESGTWSCQLRLEYNDIAVLHSNGKGMSEIYCLASGHAELFERFMNSSIEQLNPFNAHFSGLQIADSSKRYVPEQIYNYFLNYLSSDENIQKYFNAILKYDFHLNYKNYYSKNSITIDPRLILYTNSTVGMSAGNTLEEAFNQGLSEIFEFYCQSQFFNKENEMYYRIDEQYITNNKLKEIIYNIKNLGYEFYIYDLSYNYNVPVLMSILIDPIQKISSLNLGSFPVFEIALERILTELYQGTFTFKDNNTILQYPFLSEGTAKHRLKFVRTLNKISLFPEKLLYNYTLVKPSSTFLLEDTNYSNQDINNYYYKLCQKLNLSIYYRNYSTIENFYALHLYIPELSLREFCYNPFKKLDINIKNDCVDFISHFYTMVDYIIQDEFENCYNEFIKLSKLFNKINLADDEILSFIGNIMLNDFGYPYHNSSSSYALIYSIIEFIYNTNLNIYIDDNDIFVTYIKHYQFILNYLKAGYPVEEIKKILEGFGGIVFEDDFNNIHNKKYLFKKIYYDNVQNIINSSEFKNFMLAIGKKK